MNTIFIIIIIKKPKRLLRGIMYILVPKKHSTQKLVAKPDQSTGDVLLWTSNHPRGKYGEGLLTTYNEPLFLF